MKFFLFLAAAWHLAASVAVAETLWIRAGDAVQLSGPIVLGAKTGLTEEGALGDFLVSTVCVSADKLTGGFAAYRIRVAAPATYYVWARMRCPLGLNESFAIIPPSQAPEADVRWALGKSGRGVHEWRWVSRGEGPELVNLSNSGTDLPWGAMGKRSLPVLSGLNDTGKLALAHGTLMFPTKIHKLSGAEPRVRVALPAGEVTIRIYAREAYDTVFAPNRWIMARPMFNPRLNLLCLTTDQDYVPTDADAGRALGLEPAKLRVDSLGATAANLPSLTADQWRENGKRPLPDWLRCPRFYTKDTWRGELAYRKPGDIAYMVRQIAACEGSAFRLSAYWGGDAYYPSRVAPHAPGLGSLDYLREAIDEGRRLGVKIVMYINPNSLYLDHPLCREVAIRRADGSLWPAGTYRIADTHYACINHPRYRKLLEEVLAEAFTEYAPAGLYVDGLTPHRCFCAHCRAKYRELFGRDMPVDKLDGPQAVLWEMVSRPELAGDPADPDANRYTQFLYRSLVEATALVSTTVKRCRPEAVTLYHSWPKPDTLPYYDGTLTEIYLDKPWRHDLWKFGELASYSNIFSVPVLFNIYLHEHGTEAEARTKMFQGLANGCYPNFWNELGMKPLFHFLRENAECFDFARTAPVRFLALPRVVRNTAAHNRIVADRTSPARPVHNRFLAPYVGMYSALTRQGLPLVSRQSSDFHEHLAGFRVLCLANEACLSDEQIEAVRRFVAAGGGLVATHETSLYDEKGNRRVDFGLADVFGCRFDRVLSAAQRTIRWQPGHPLFARLNTDASLSHDDVHLVVRLQGGTSLAELAGRDADAERVPAVVVHEYGAGRVVYLPGRLDAMQCDVLNPAVERLFGNAVAWAARGSLPVEVQASAPVAATLFDQPDRRILHLVSLNGDSLYRSDRIEPVKNVRIRLQIPDGAEVVRVRRLWDKANLAVKASQNLLAFTLESLGEYEAVAVEFQGAPKRTR